MNALTVHGLSVRFTLSDAIVAAVTEVTFDLHTGECLALVGESGCGKSVLAASLLGFLPGNAELAGSAHLTDERGVELELLTTPETQLATEVRGRRIGLVPQSPAAHLTPVRTARDQLEEAVRVLCPDETDRRDRADTVAARAGLEPGDLDRYPHQLSGGMAQRVATALALVGEPWLILADEPTTGLDRTLVTALVAELRRLVNAGRAVLLITHDLTAAAQVADRIAVMYAGRIVELGPTTEVLDHSRHPYTRGLLAALPERDFTPIPGTPPLLTDLPTGCAFRPRCDHATAHCAEHPHLSGDPQHSYACHHPC